MNWSTHVPRLLAVTAAAVGITGAGAPAAKAGSYQALSCDYAPVDGKDDAWEQFAMGGGGFAISDACPSGGDSALGLSARQYSRNPLRSKHGWEFKTPPGASLSRFEGKINGYSGGERSAGSGLYSPKTDYGVRYGMNPFQDPRGYGPGASGDPVAVGLPNGVTTLAAAVFCGGESADCHPNPGSSEAKVSLTAARVTVEDPVMPSLTLTGGSLAASPAQSGTSDVVLDASDNVGVKEARLLIDGVERDRETFGCDYSAAIPCSNQTAKRLSFDSKTVPDGTHTARVEVLDAGGNSTGENRELTVGNGSSPPPSTDGESGGGAGGAGGGSSSSTTTNNTSASESTVRETVTQNGGGLLAGASLAPESVITLKTSRRSVKNGRSVAFSGTVTAGTQPFNDVIIALQAKVGRKWVTFRHVRTGGTGVFGARYRFTRTFRTQTYTFRARASKQRGFTADRNSRSVRVKVRR